MKESGHKCEICSSPKSVQWIYISNVGINQSVWLCGLCIDIFKNRLGTVKR